MLQDLGREPRQVIVDRGYRGVDTDNPGVPIIHRGKSKSLTEHVKKLLKRRQAIEPLIGHTKADHRMDRCRLQGVPGDALHALSCAAGYNIRWLLRAIARLGLGGPSCALFALVVYVVRRLTAALAAAEVTTANGAGLYFLTMQLACSAATLFAASGYLSVKLLLTAAARSFQRPISAGAAVR